MTVVLSLLDTPAFGGAEQYLLQHLYLLQRSQKFHVILATNRAEVKDRVRLDGSQIELIHLPYRLDAIGNWKGLLKYIIQAPIALVWFLITLVSLAKKYKKIIVYTPGFSDRMLFSPFIKLLGHRLVWLEFGPLQPLFKRNWGFPKLLYKLGTPYPDKVITISEYTKKCLLRDTDIPPQKIQIIYPTTPKISEQELRTFRRAGAAWRKKYRLENKKLITFVGRLASEKEVDLLIKAFHILSHKINNLHLVIVGDGPERPLYEQLTDTLKLKRSVLFTGFVSESIKKMILATSDVFVFPSAWELEGFGMTTIEAMMLETPIVSSGAGPQAEIIEHQKTGLIFSEHTPQGLATQISQILSVDTKASFLASNGRSKVIQYFS
jgi:glycosyltransferase involved in cell wall biosynthesis